jgi:hypothetical protein
MLTHEEVGRQRHRPVAEAGDALDAAIGAADQDRRDPAEIDDIRLHHAQHEARGHAGIDGIAAGFQDGKPGAEAR